MILHIYTIIHTLVSLIAIFTGLVVVFGMLGGRRLDGLDEVVSHHCGGDDRDRLLLSV
jgi:hypothetical protein